MGGRETVRKVAKHERSVALASGRRYAFLDSLEGVAGPHTYDFVIAQYAFEQLTHTFWIRQHELHYLLRSAKGAWITTGKHLPDVDSFVSHANQYMRSEGADHRTISPIPPEWCDDFVGVGGACPFTV